MFCGFVNFFLLILWLFMIFFLHIAKVDFYGYMGFVDFICGRARKNRSVLLWQSAKNRSVLLYGVVFVSKFG